MSARIVVSMFLALAVAASHAADVPLVARYEQAQWVSRPSDFWMVNATTDCYFILRFKIDTTGRAVDITIAEEGFATEKQIEAGVAYLKGSRFKPATRNGEPVEVTLTHAFEGVSAGMPRSVPSSGRNQRRSSG